MDYLQHQAASPSAERGARVRGKDYRETLGPEDFAVFARPRELRKDVAQSEFVPRHRYEPRAKAFLAAWCW
ncbi:MAG: hypothetical protein AB7O38_03595 [Pirellulaceae bacterium]